MNFTLLALENISDALTEFGSIFSSVWTFLTSNWYFTALIIVPIGGLIISTILGFIRSSR